MATLAVVETGTIGNDGAGQVVQAICVPSEATQVVTYTTTTRTAIAFRPSTRVVTLCTDGTKGYVKFGDENVTAGIGPNGFDSWQPANAIVSYVIDPNKVTHVAVYDGSS